MVKLIFTRVGLLYLRLCVQEFEFACVFVHAFVYARVYGSAFLCKWPCLCEEVSTCMRDKDSSSRLTEKCCCRY